MPTFEFTISDKALERLQLLAARYNENTGKNLTLKEWMVRHLKELAIGPELHASLKDLEERRDEDHKTASKAKFEELLDALGDE